MLRTGAILALGLILATPAASWTNHEVLLSGDHGLEAEVTGGHDYVCDDTFRATQGRARNGTQFGVTIWESGGGSWTGGFIDTKLTRDDSWQFCKDIDGAGLRIRSGPFAVRGCRILMSEDSLRYQFGGSDLADSEGNWITDTRDDSHECDGRPAHIRIRRCYLDNIHTIISTRRGSASRDGNPPPVLIEIRGTVISMAEDHYDPREKRQFAWNSGDLGDGLPSNKTHGHGQYFKTENRGARDTLLLAGNTIYARRLPKQSKTNTRVIKEDAIIHPDSGGNVFVWDPTPQYMKFLRNAGIAMVTVNGVEIPEQLGLHKHTNIFKVTDDPKVWNDTVAKWKSEVWEGKAPPPPTGNRAPTVDAGPNQTITLPTNMVNLDGTVSDPDGDTTTKSWSKVSGPGTVTFGNASAEDTTATFSKDGSYVLKLTAGDGSLSASDEVTITVNPEPTGGGTPGVIASDDFESGNTSGGTGWSGAWQRSGFVSITRFGSPRELYHLRVMADGTAVRAVNLAGVSEAKLRFFYKGDSLEAGEYGSVEVNDGTGWHEVFRHGDPDDDNTYRQAEVDLSAFDMTSGFQIRVSGHGTSTSDVFYVDEIEIEGVGGTTPPPPGSGDMQVPTAPGSLTLRYLSSNLVYLTWTASTDNVGVTGYTVLRNGQPVGQTSNTAFVDRSVTRGAQYVYTVVAFDAAGNVSAPSNEVGVVVP